MQIYLLLVQLLIGKSLPIVHARNKYVFPTCTYIYHTLKSHMFDVYPYMCRILNHYHQQYDKEFIQYTSQSTFHTFDIYIIEQIYLPHCIYKHFALMQHVQIYTFCHICGRNKYDNQIGHINAKYLMGIYGEVCTYVSYTRSHWCQS